MMTFINQFISKKNLETFAVSSFLNVRICCFPSLFLSVNEESLGFELLAGQEKQLENVTSSSGQQ